MDKKITPQHWEAFRLCCQGTMGAHKASEKMGIGFMAIKQLLSELRKWQPKLFPQEREKFQFGHENMNRAGYKLVNFDDVNESEIKEVF